MHVGQAGQCKVKLVCKERVSVESVCVCARLMSMYVCVLHVMELLRI